MRRLSVYFSCSVLAFVVWTFARILTVDAAAGCTLATISDAFVRFLMGPQCLVGTGSPGAAQLWFESVGEYDSGIQVIQRTYPTGNMWSPSQHLLTGTISIGAGGTTVTRTAGAVDMRQPCGGGSSPLSDAYIVVAVPGSVTTDGIDENTYIPVSSCTDASHLVVSHAWTRGSPSVLPASVTNVGFAFYYSGVGTDWAAQASFPDYDNPTSEYTQHFRNTGDTVHLALANSYASEIWYSPDIGRGYCGTNISGFSSCFPPRAFDMQGSFTWLGINGDPGGVWAGMRAFRNNGGFTPFFFSSLHYFLDLRDTAYQILGLADGCFADPDPTEQANWCDRLVDAASNIAIAVAERPTNFMATYFPGQGSYTTSSTVNISGTMVTLVGTTWNAGAFAYHGNGGDIMFFSDPTQQPIDNTGDVGDCTYVDSTHCTLAVSHATVTGYGYVLPQFDDVALGYGNQPVFIALLVDAFEQAAAALDHVGGYTSTRDAYRSYGTTGTQYLLDYSASQVIGTNYLSRTANCPPGNNFTPCKNSGGNNNTALSYSLELPRALAQNYYRTGNAAISTFATNMVNAMYENHIGNGMVDCTQANYLYAYDHLCIGHGGGDYVLPTAGVNGAKFYGQLTGINGAYEWWAVSSPFALTLPARMSRGGRTGGRIAR